MTSMERELRSILRESVRGTFEEVGGFPVLEVNHCHGPGRGHPCVGGEQMTLPGGFNLKARQEGFEQARQAAVADPRPFYQRAAKVRSPHKVQKVSPGPGEHPDLVAKYRGMNINWQRPYQNSYYVDAPGFGSFHSKRSIGSLRKEIDRFVDTGVTQYKAERARASARYQKRKARYGR